MTAPTPLEVAATALREAAVALEAVPYNYRRRNVIFGNVAIVKTEELIAEAAHLEALVGDARKALGLEERTA